MPKMPTKKTRTNSGGAKAAKPTRKEPYEEDDGGGRPSRSQRKREEKAARRAELVAKKAEARRLAKEEEAELVVKARKQKLTEAERLRRWEEELAAQQREEEKRKKAARRWVYEREYAGVVCVANTNREVSDVDARNVDEAIAQLVFPEGGGGGWRSVHLAGYKAAFEEKHMERVKREKPGMTQAQYNDAVRKLWNKSPENPQNQMQLWVSGKKKNQARAGFGLRQHKAISTLSQDN